MNPMKTYILIIITVLSAGGLRAQTAGQDVTNGLAYLGAKNLAAANQQFVKALALSPTNESANALAAVTRLLFLPSTPAGSNLLNSLGFSGPGRDIYNWTSTLPVNAEGRGVLPSSPTTAAMAFCLTNIMPALAASRTNLEMITDPKFTLSLTAAETSSQAVTIDYGDILLLRALERVAEFIGYTAGAQNDTVIPSQFQSLKLAGTLNVQTVLSLYPSLLTLASPADLAASKVAFSNAIVQYLAASDFIRDARAPGVTALFNLSDDETNDEAIFRDQLTNVLVSLNGPATFPATNFITSTVKDFVTLDASNYFAGTKTLRSLLPKFNGNSYVNNTLPDYSFGGILRNEPAYLIEEMLRKTVSTHAGIYAGDGGLSDNNYTINNGSGGSGSFAVFVGTNQQAILAGTDDGDGTDDGNDFGLILQFSVDNEGNWQVYSNNFSAYGSINNDGTFWGELDVYTNDSVFSVYFNASQQSALGSFQTAAGFYMTSSSSPKTFGILAPDGQIFMGVFHGNGTLSSSTGGSAQFGANDQFTTTNIGGTKVSATLNPSTFQITGTSDKLNTGTITPWTLSRTAKVPFDLPPAITQNLPAATTAPAGANLTIAVTATGSSPLSFQWYSNGIPLAWTTAGTLVLSNLQFSSAGTFSVTIENTAGATNSAVTTLAVVPETVPPTNQIILPASGSQVSNSVCTVTGKAGDNVAVSNVLVQINQGGWNPATSSNEWKNWTIQVPLIPGSNLLQAFAVDTSGNVSKTNAVLFKCVVTAPLTVQLGGRGTISPNDSNALLQVGAVYNLTAAAVAGTGFAFTNWTGGTRQPLAWLTNGATLKFTMASNLVLRANFADVGRPVLTVTNVASGMLVSNVAYVVRGAATDNVAVATVNGRLNGGAWTNVTSLNGSSWADDLMLAPGTNRFQAYAVDTSGNVSPTNSVNLVYVVNTPLTVWTNGLGVLTPNENGAWLQIGKNYAITAAAAPGFRFTNWSGGTSLPLGVITNRPTIQFLMAANLILQANFVDTNPPTLTITAPAAGAHISNGVAVVTCTATDNWKVNGVWCQLNSNSWTSATSTNMTNWTTTFELVAGTNTIRAFATDLGGNDSRTNSVSIYSSIAFNFRLSLPRSQSAGPSGMVFNLGASTGLNGRILVSTNLTDWAVLTNFVGTDSEIIFSDPGATNGMRFYRAVVP